MSEHRALPWTTRLAVLAVACASSGALGSAQQPASPSAPPASVPRGTLERLTVHGRALEGNLEGDSPDRPVVVYLPPSYAKEPSRRYPVLYFLHGYTATAESYVTTLAAPDSMDRAIAAGAREMIVVIPDAYTKYGGSMYASSPTVGDWETFIAQELPAFIDKRYRTIASRDGRGLAGHSMGGYGTMRVGMKRPGAFAALTASRQLDEALTRLVVPHTFEVYEGDHGNRIRERFESHVLPFFSRYLTVP